MTAEDALPHFLAAGIQADVDGDNLVVTTGAPSGNLCILALQGATALAEFPLEASMILSQAPSATTPTGIQYFYRCEQSEPTRKLTTTATIHGDGDTVPTFPSPGFQRVRGSLTQIVTLSWGDHCKLVDLILDDAPLPPDLPPAGGPSSCTQKNMADTFRIVYGERFRHCKVWGQWLEFTGSRWAPERTELAFDCMVRLIHSNNLTSKTGPASAGFALGAEKIAAASRPFATLPEEWDRNNWQLNTPAGVIDLQTGDIQPHAKTDYLTKCCKVSPSEAPHPIFDRFLRDITLEDGGLAEYLQTALGACLSGAIQDNFLLFWYGDRGQNGKNSLSEVIAMILGDYADWIPTETLMASKNTQHLTFLASLRGLRLAMCSEVAEGSAWNEQRIKSLTGDARISANYMRHDPFSFDRTHRHIVLGNHRPILRVVDPAIKARLHIVPFKAHFDEQTRDPQMGEKLRSEAPQILYWLIQGHNRWLENGRILKKCSAVQAETESYFEAQSTPDMWIAEQAIEDPDKYCGAKELYNSFRAWKEGRGEGAYSQTRWAEWMSQRYTKSRNGSGLIYRGLELKPTSVFENRS